MKFIGNKNVKLVVWLLIAVTLLSGCIPRKYKKSQEEALIQACMPAINEFLSKRYSEYELGEFHVKEGLIEPENALLGRYGSNVVRGSYTTAGNTWDLFYDMETGEFYTGELVEKLMKQEEARILEYLKDELPKEDIKDFELTVLDINYMVMSHDIKIDSSTTKDTYVYIPNVLPAEITEDNLPEFAERGFDGGFISRIACHYFSDKANALTDEDFEQFFSDNPAYSVEQYVLIYNDNPSAKEDSTSGSETDEKNAPESAEETLFSPKPVGEDADLRIEYENGAILARSPHFTESGGIVTMRFNAIDWYRVRVISIDDAKKYFPDEKMLTKSSNLKVFPSYENQEFDYSCVFVPNDGSNFAFLFETDTSPEANDFGFGFNDSIQYYAGGEEVFPDVETDIDANSKE